MSERDNYTAVFTPSEGQSLDILTKSREITEASRRTQRRYNTPQSVPERRLAYPLKCACARHV